MFVVSTFLLGIFSLEAFFLGGDLGFLFLYHLGEEYLAFFSVFCIDIKLFSGAVRQAREEAALPQVIIDLIHASCS